MEQKQTVGQATASMVLGILSLIITGILTAIPAVICGHVAKSKIKQNPDTLQGDGQALAGLIMGYIVIGFSVLLIPLMAAIAIPAFSKARDNAETMMCYNQLQIIEHAKTAYAIEHELPEGSIVSGEQLDPYIQGGTAALQCRKNGEYLIQPVGRPAECTVHGLPE